MTEEVTTGAEQVPAAVEQEESFDLESILFGDSEEKVADEGADNPVTETEQAKAEVPNTDDLPTEDASKAFAKKWAAESEKLEEKIRQKVTQEIEQKTRTTPQEQADGASTHKEMTQEQLEKLADDLETSPKVVSILYQQQQLINRQTEEARKSTQRMKEQNEYSEAVKYANQLRQGNDSPPAWDDQKIHQYRMDYYRQYGGTIPWKEAYKMYVADSVLSGDLRRQAQQEVVQNIQKRDTASVGPKSPSSQKMTIDDLTSDQFNQMVEDAKLGKFKRS